MKNRCRSVWLRRDGSFKPPEPLDPELVAALPKTRQPTQEEIAAAREKTAKARR